MKKNTRPLIIILTLVCLALLVIILIDSFTLPYPSLSDNSSHPYNSGWALHTGDLEEDVVLPVKLTGDHVNVALTITHVLEDDLPQDSTLLIRTSQQYLRVLLNGVVIYAFEETAGTGQTPGSQWHLVKIPSDARVPACRSS